MEALIKATQKGVLKGIANIELVFSNNPNAKGLEIAKQMGINTLHIDSFDKKRKTFDQEIINALVNYNFDYIILAGYMRILSKELIQAFPNKIINIHPADTRKHQGLHAYEWAFNNRLKETKITIHYVNEGVDTGEIIAQATVDLEGVKNLEEVEKRGLAVEHQFYAETLYKLFTKN
jgi:phosphoribosylglycinamide formyltransferase-1